MDLSEQKFPAGLGDAKGTVAENSDSTKLVKTTVADGSHDRSPESTTGARKTQPETAWQQEISARLDRYRARRKMRPPRYPSLKLQFDAVPPSHTDATKIAVPPPAFEPRSHHALPLNGLAPSPPEERDQAQEMPSGGAQSNDAPAARSVHWGAKIIEFPKFDFEPPVLPPDQLAEPVSEHPRILEVPETVPPPPALGGITIESSLRVDTERRPGIDIPLQSAGLARRIVGSLIDGLIVAVAAVLFGVIFWKVTAVRPPQAQFVGMAVGGICLFWAIYQYLLLVYAASTPGLWAAGLELARFDGTPTNRSLRRWRVLASYLSAASLGMGYAWVFLDEDALCWHDRITHTYLAPKKRPTDVMSSPPSQGT